MNREISVQSNRFWSWVTRFTRENRSVGILRLLLIAGAIVGMAFLGGMIFTPREQFPYVMLTLPGLRFWIFPVVAFLLALNLAAIYIRDLYELPSTSLGRKYILSVLFLTGLPHLEVSEGKLQTNPSGVNLLEVVGGPGILNITPGNVVLLERMDGPSNVYPAGYQYITRRETIKTVASLEDQHGYIETARATTKDGIEVTVRDIRYHYRLRANRRGGEYLQREAANPFPFSARAMRDFTYNRTFSPRGLTTLQTAMDFTIEGVITDFIRQHQFDRLTTPSFGELEPREAIKRNFSTERVQERIRNLGMDLQWVDIGHFDVTDKVWKQRVEGWGTKWVGTAQLERSVGEARRQAYREIGRVEAQAQLIIELARQLNQLRAQGGQTGPGGIEDLRRLVLVYTAQIMDDLSRKPESLNRPEDG